MMRALARLVTALVAIVVVVAITWIVWVSTDARVPFAELQLTGLSLDAHPRLAEGAPGTGRVFVSFAYDGPSRGRCVRPTQDVKVAVGGVIARVETWGGGRWVLGETVPLPVHVCRNVAVFVIDERRLGPGIVAASLGDGRGNAALISARDLMVPPDVVVESVQPAERESRATLAVLPALALGMTPTITRGTSSAWPVDVAGHRATFTVPTQWRGAGDVTMSAHRTAPPLRCERRSDPALRCAASALPVRGEVPFDVVSKLARR